MSEAVSVCPDLVINQVSASCAGGSYFNGLAPTNTLGCGSWGHNSISENLDYKHLMNVSPHCPLHAEQSRAHSRRVVEVSDL